MGERGVNLSALQLQLTIARQNRETARVALIALGDPNRANPTALAAARQNLATATAEIARLERELQAAEEAH